MWAIEQRLTLNDVTQITILTQTAEEHQYGASHLPNIWHYPTQVCSPEHLSLLGTWRPYYLPPHLISLPVRRLGAHERPLGHNKGLGH